MKKFMSIIALIGLVILGGFKIHNEIDQIKQQKSLDKAMAWAIEHRYDKKSLLEDLEKKAAMEKMTQDKIEEIADFMNSEEYKEREYVRDLKEKYGIESDNYIIMDMHLSYYSDLNCENGYGNLTATGEVLAPGMVANNRLSFGTQVHFEGHGVKVVKDRGSERYFSEVNKFDVFVPRRHGESDGQYLARVNNMGRDVVKGIIFL